MWRADWRLCLAPVLRAIVLTLLTMTFTSTNNSSSIFEGGKLKPGTYKIQNIFSETFLDVEVHSRELLCRPSLKEGMGLVRPHPLPLVRT